MILEVQSLFGVFSLQRLFVGSKSEALYPVFESENGVSYRVRIPTDKEETCDPLSEYYDRRVRVSGLVDHIRGHWRISIVRDKDSLLDIEVVSVNSQGEA